MVPILLQPSNFLFRVRFYDRRCRRYQLEPIHGEIPKKVIMQMTHIAAIGFPIFAADPKNLPRSEPLQMTGLSSTRVASTRQLKSLKNGCNHSDSWGLGVLGVLGFFNTFKYTVPFQSLKQNVFQEFCYRSL